MKNSLKIIYLLCALCIVCAVCLVVLYHMYHFDDTQVIFLDIGQGDAILIMQGTNQILIDGGPDGTVLLEEMQKYMPFWDRDIEIVVATHADGDHIDGLTAVFEHYRVHQLWHTHAHKNTATEKKLYANAHAEEGCELVPAFHGLTAFIGGHPLRVIYPYAALHDIEDINDASIVTVFSVGEEQFYLGGDITTPIEDTLPVDENITILKASHHGSHTSSSAAFLRRTQPRDVIISAGRDNRYGHPHPDVLQNAFRVGARVLRTDVWGSIAYTCDEHACMQQ